MKCKENYFEIYTGNAKLQEAANMLAEQTGISIEEASSRFFQATQTLKEAIKDIIERLWRMFEEIEASIIEVPSRNKRRKLELEQMRITEQKYTCRIKQYKRYPFYKRIYKPP